MILILTKKVVIFFSTFSLHNFSGFYFLLVFSVFLFIFPTYVPHFLIVQHSMRSPILSQPSSHDFTPIQNFTNIPPAPPKD